MDFGSMSDGELRRLHAMFLANPQSFANNPAYMHALIQENARRFSPGNVESDLEAASVPIEPDPMAGPVRKRSRADWAVDAATSGGMYSPSENVDAMTVGAKPSLSAALQSANTLASPEAFDAAFRNNGNHYPSATAAFAEELVARGVDPGYAQRAAAARAEEHRAPSHSGVYAEEMAATEDPNALYPGYRATPPGITTGQQTASGSGLPDADPRTTVAQRLEQHAQWAADVDRRAEAYNRATGMPQPSGLAADDGYRDWSGWTHGNRLPPGRSDTQRMLDARAQADAERDARLQPMLDADRKDNAARQAWLENPENEAAARDVSGVKARERADDYRRERMMYRHAQQTGIPIEQIRAENPSFASVGSARDGSMPTLVKTKDGMQVRDVPITTSTMRDQAAQARIDAAKKREDAWRSQMMLAGGNPRKNAVNAWNALGDESLNDWQRLTMAKALRPDIDGTSPLTVEANSARNAMRLINADMAGQGGLGDTRRQMMQQQTREAADQLAQQEAAKLLGWNKKTITRQEAERIRRRVEAKYPGMGSVVEGLPIEEEVQAARPSSGPPVPPPAPGPMNGLPRFGS